MDGENDQLLSDIFIRDSVSEVECYIKAWVGNMAFNLVSLVITSQSCVNT